MAVSTVAFRYAKSLLDLSEEMNLTDVIYKDMMLFKGTVEESRPLMVMLKNPIVRTEKKHAVMNAVFSSRVNPVTMSFFQIITRKNREAIMDAIADEYIRLYNELRGIEQATVVTTVPLTDELRERFKATVSQMTGRKLVELHEKIDSKLIGGYVLRVGDQELDGSLRSRLTELRLQFMN
ncbi:ATP synthase F1 subunit delta [Fibrisoma montanum]|uniref:ATP synthase subunit delta n=1 Tax=Fibrisoma montanum TaxID=2305895 RepID=A0A418MHK7_9BACT|nr:ATP synthase F1 subunit delta [Fibrisoma montanum]RIV26910.1 ATP synthase F1 subunit delta [Fibrisoma montanum]